jgi:uncharacterized pyridoxal phosphate-containing UPF0001 family protein
MDREPATTGLEDVRRRLIAAAVKAHRDPATVTLIAVSKTKDAEAISPVLAAGHRVFAENRVQEAATKWPLLRQPFGDLKLHLIGPLQTNKTADAVRLFDAGERGSRAAFRPAALDCQAQQPRRPEHGHER